MNRKLLVALGLTASLANSATCFAQVPAAPASPAIPGMPAPAAPAAPSGGGNIWSMLCPTAEQKAACKNCICNSPIGQILGGMAGPMALTTGGMMGGGGGCCAQNSLLNDLKKAADDPNGLAARIKQDEADAKARRAAIRYLGTVDCTYWPEATEVLKSALRKDRSECVRFEAALSLRRGCCCNKETIEALTNCVLGDNKKDPFPVERSERVRAVAAEALIRCPQIVHEQQRLPEKLVKNDSKPLVPDEFAKKVHDLSTRDLTASAHSILASLQERDREKVLAEEKAHTEKARTPIVPPPPGALLAPRHNNNSVSGIVANAFSSPSHPAAEATARQPFFSNLTRTLTGKQDASPSARQHGTVSNAAPPPESRPTAAPGEPANPAPRFSFTLVPQPAATVVPQSPVIVPQSPAAVVPQSPVILPQSPAIPQIPAVVPGAPASPGNEPLPARTIYVLPSAADGPMTTAAPGASVGPVSEPLSARTIYVLPSATDNPSTQPSPAVPPSLGVPYVTEGTGKMR